MKRLPATLIVSLVFLSSLFAGEPANTMQIRKKLSQYTMVDLHAETSSLPESEQRALAKMIEAARAIDDIYWKQRSSNGLELLAKYEKQRSLPARDLAHYLKINYGPYDKSDGDKPFIGDKSLPDGALFYPEDMTKEEFERYVAAHPEVKNDFEKINTVIRR